MLLVCNFLPVFYNDYAFYFIKWMNSNVWWFLDVSLALKYISLSTKVQDIIKNKYSWLKFVQTTLYCKSWWIILLRKMQILSLYSIISDIKMKVTCCTCQSSMYLLRKKIDSCLKNDASKSLAAAIFYGFCSISLNFLNKAVVSSYNFNFPFFIMFCQMLLVIGVLSILR